MREISLYGLRGRGKELAALSALNRYRHVRLCDWLTDEDARALAMSPHLRGVESLEIWLGGTYEQAVCHTFATSQVLAELRELRLVQVLGGLSAKGASTALAAHADERAAEVDQLRSRPVAQVVRPFAKSFHLAHDLRHELYAGRLPHNFQALVAKIWKGGLYIAVFDPSGNLVRVENRDPKWPEYPVEPPPMNVDREELLQYLRTKLGREPNPILFERDDSYEVIMGYLGNEFGFTPSSIRIKEFATEEGLFVHLLPEHYVELAQNPDQPLPGDDEETYQCVRTSVGQWLIRGDFVIEWGNDYWAGPDGVIHSS